MLAPGLTLLGTGGPLPDPKRPGLSTLVRAAAQTFSGTVLVSADPDPDPDTVEVG